MPRTNRGTFKYEFWSETPYEWDDPSHILKSRSDILSTIKSLQKQHALSLDLDFLFNFSNTHKIVGNKTM